MYNISFSDSSFVLDSYEYKSGALQITFRRVGKSIYATKQGKVSYTYTKDGVTKSVSSEVTVYFNRTGEQYFTLSITPDDNTDVIITSIPTTTTLVDITQLKGAAQVSAEWDTGNCITVRIIAASGYTVNEGGTFYTQKDSDAAVTRTLSSSSKVTDRIVSLEYYRFYSTVETFYVTGDGMFTGGESYIDVKSNLTNVTAKDLPTTAQVGDSITLDLTPKSGYILTKVTVSYTDTSKDAHTDIIDITSTTHLQTTYTIPSDVDGSITIVAVAAKTITVDTDLSNVTAKDLPTTVQVGDSITLDLTPDSGYHLTTVKVSYYNTSGYIHTDSIDITDTSHLQTTYTVPSDVDDEITIVAVAESGGVKTITVDTDLSHVTAKDLPTTAQVGDSITLDLTPDSGYHLTTVKVSYYNTSGYYHTDTIDITDTSHLQTTYRVRSDVDEEITIVAVAESGGGKTITVDTDLSNVTAKDLPTTAQVGDSITLDLTPDSGYHLTTVNVSYYNTSGYIHTDAIDITDTSHLQTTYTVPSDVDEGITIVAVAEKSATTIINNVPHASYTYTKLTDNTWLIYLIAATGYKLTSATATYINTSGIEFSDPFDLTKTPATCSVTTNGDTITLNGTTEKEASGIAIIPDLSNVTAKDLPTTAQVGDSITLDLTPDSGYHLTTVKVSYYNTSGYIHTDTIDITDTSHLQTTYTVPSDVDEEITIVAIADQTENPLTKYGTINGYIADKSVLNTFASKRFFTENIGTTDSPTYEQIDLGSFVVSLKCLHFDVPTAAKEYVYCGKYSINVTANVLNSATVTHEFGTLTLPEYAHSAHDTNNSYKVYLPFVGFVEVDGKYSGKTLSLTYTVSCVNGKGFATLGVDQLILAQHECDVSTPIYYQLSSDKVNTIGSSDFGVDEYKGLLPYLITEYTQELPDKYPTDNTTAIISTFEGYSQFTDIEMCPTANMTDSDYKDIITLLQSGVIL